MPAELTFRIDVEQVKNPVIEKTIPAGFTASETFDIGMDTGQPVADAYFERAPFSFNGIETCGRCDGSLKVIAYIEDQDVIDRILDHLRQEKRTTHVRPLLVPPTRAG